MKTVLQELIQWTIENAFNVEAQDGTNYIAIDYEEMRTKFDTWLEKEKKQVSNSVVNEDFLDWHCPKCGKKSCNTHCD